MVANQDFTRTGYTFEGWNTKQDGTGTDYAVGASYTGNAELKLYAKWKKITYTVTYNANNGTGAPASQIKEYGTALTLSTTRPTRTGYTFEGWNTSSSGTGTNYAPGASYAANENVTLYAKWKVVPISVADVKANPSKYYGAYVNYVPKNGCLVKWRVFYADSIRIYLIAEDYVPNWYLTATGLTTNESYKVYSSTSRQDLVTRLTTSSYYTEFKDTAGKASSVVGAPTLEQFKTSYNAVNTDSTKQMDILNCTKGQNLQVSSLWEGEGGYADGDGIVNANGYVLRFGNSNKYAYWFSMPTDANKRDLYAITSATNAERMWLASFNARSDNEVMNVTSSGLVDDAPCDYDESGVRPLVTLNSNVKLVDPDGDGTYDLQ